MVLQQQLLRPLLVLGIWWARLTARGAVVGMVVGLVASAGSIGIDLFAGTSTGGLISLGLTAPDGETVLLIRKSVTGVIGVQAGTIGVGQLVLVLYAVLRMVGLATELSTPVTLTTRVVVKEAPPLRIPGDHAKFGSLPVTFGHE